MWRQAAGCASPTGPDEVHKMVIAHARAQPPQAARAGRGLTLEAATTPSASGLTDEQQDFVAALRDFVERETVGGPGGRPPLRRGGRQDGRAGLVRAPDREEYGGSGGSFLDACLFLEETPAGRSDRRLRGDPDLRRGAQPLRHRGAEARPAGPRHQGGTLAIAMSEPDSGSDVASLKCKAGSRTASG
jgi:alkylation response protein AidB-like acyl-CoA dehydrogenase